MRNMFGVLKISLFGIFILLISTQTFAICEAEIEDVVSIIPAKCFFDRRGTGMDTSYCNNINQIRQGYIDSLNKILNGTNEYYVYHLSEPRLTNRINKLASNPAEGALSDDLSKKYWIAHNRFDICALKAYRDKINKTPTQSQSDISASQTQQSQNNNSNQPQSSDSQQAQQLKQRAQESQQQAQQNQQRAEQEVQKGKRRRHEPENEAHHCLTLDKSGLFGGFINKCNFKISYSFCNYNPKKDSWADAHNCVGRAGNSDFVGAGRTSAAHIKNTETVYWFACKDPAWSLDTEYVPGQGLAGRCRTVGGN